MLLTVLCGFALTSCGDDDDNGNGVPEELEVNPSAISLLASANSSATFTITYGGNWTVSGAPEWLNVSSMSGKGNTSLVVTSISANSSATNRECTLTVSGNDTQASVVVSQLAGLKSGCEVMITDKLIFSDNCTFVLDFGSNASYFYAGFLPATSAGWTDEKIVQTMIDDDNPRTAEDSKVMCASGLNPETQYLAVFAAYDAQGNRGELIREPFTTPKYDNTPLAIISYVSYDNENWYWETTLGATATEYIMASWEGDLAVARAYLYETSETGLYLRNRLSTLTTYVQSSSWYMSRDDDELYICTWAKKNESWGANLYTFFGRINDDEEESSIVKNTPARSTDKVADRPTITCCSWKQLEADLAGMKIATRL